MWSEPRAIAAADGTQASMLFFDTEGFESTGKADAYDDRIFALSTLISAILLYNLPETVRESDIEKLSFAVELAKAFYPTEHGRGSGQAEQAAPVEPGSMLWVIQRDFLEGDSVGKMVHEALSPVANPQSDHDIAQMNQVRQGLRSIARNSTAIGLKQPHLNRTQLCQLTDAELNPDYRTGRDRLRALVSALAQPKMIRGKVMDGPALSALVRQMVAALNEGDIPSATSIVQNFNRDLLYRCLEQYAEEMLAAQLPLQELELQSAHEAAQARAMARFDRQHFGNPSVDSSSGSTLRDGLLAAIAKEYRSRVAENTVASSKRCDMLEAECERELDLLQSARLPSLNRFQARFQRCNVKFQHGCFGPAAASTDGRLQRQYDRELHRFRQQYNDRLFNGLVGVSIADIIVFRFLSRNPSLELLGWAGFLFLEVSPKLLLGSGGLYESPWWLALARVWEMVVYNPVADLETWWPALVLVAAVGFAFRRWRLWRARRTKRHRRRQSKKRRGWHTTSSSDEDGEGKDLDV